MGLLGLFCLSSKACIIAIEVSLQHSKSSRHGPTEDELRNYKIYYARNQLSKSRIWNLKEKWNSWIRKNFLHCHFLWAFHFSHLLRHRKRGDDFFPGPGQLQVLQGGGMIALMCVSWGFRLREQSKNKEGYSGCQLDLCCLRVSDMWDFDGLCGCMSWPGVILKRILPNSTVW